jgi:hypothetical protein
MFIVRVDTASAIELFSPFKLQASVVTSLVGACFAIDQYYVIVNCVTVTLS